jgi:NADH-quinone oxidoreductase subunit E
MDKEFRETVIRLMERFPEKESALLPALCMLQDRKGHVSEEGMRSVAAIFKVPEARVFSVASYYSMLRLRPEGKYIIQICSNIVCTILNEHPLFDHISGALGITDGETTPDGLFSIIEVECLGACGYAPTMLINSERYENVTPDMVDEVISSIRKREGMSRDQT